MFVGGVGTDCWTALTVCVTLDDGLWATDWTCEGTDVGPAEPVLGALTGVSGVGTLGGPLDGGGATGGPPCPEGDPEPPDGTETLSPGTDGGVPPFDPVPPAGGGGEPPPPDCPALEPELLPPVG
jgi:hypothetical protein